MLHLMRGQLAQGDFSGSTKESQRRTQLMASAGDEGELTLPCLSGRANRAPSEEPADPGENNRTDGPEAQQPGDHVAEDTVLIDDQSTKLKESRPAGMINPIRQQTDWKAGRQANGTDITPVLPGGADGGLIRGHWRGRTLRPGDHLTLRVQCEHVDRRELAIKQGASTVPLIVVIIAFGSGNWRVTRPEEVRRSDICRNGKTSQPKLTRQLVAKCEIGRRIEIEAEHAISTSTDRGNQHQAGEQVESG